MTVRKHLKYRLFRGNDTSFPSAKEEHKIVITFTDENDVDALDAFGVNHATYGTVVGYMSKEFEYEAHGNYSDVWGNVLPSSMWSKPLEELTQRNLTNYGYMSKKIFTHGDSPTISISFRCWAGDDESPGYSDFVKGAINNPVEVGNALINATLPRVSENKNAILGPTVTKEMLEFGTKAIPNAAMAAGKAIVNVGEGEWKKALQNVRELVNKFTSKKPPVCRVSIGNIFEKSFMVVKDVSMKLSKEYFAKGVPLYGDFNVTFQSLFAGTVLGTANVRDPAQELIFGSGLNSKVGSTRVTFDDSAPDISPVVNQIGNSVQQIATQKKDSSFMKPESTRVAPKTPTTVDFGNFSFSQISIF